MLIGAPAEAAAAADVGVRALQDALQSRARAAAGLLEIPGPVGQGLTPIPAGHAANVGSGGDWPRAWTGAGRPGAAACAGAGMASRP
jgi:hypothetical protein